MPTKKPKASKVTAPKERESDVLRGICEYLALKQHFFWRSNNIPAFDRQTGRVWNMPKYGMNGTPDIILIQDGFFIGIEVKRKGGKLSPAQITFQQRCRDNGAEYYVVRSIDDLREVGL